MVFNTKWLVGIDEVGRGPLAGPITLCLFAIQTTDIRFRRDFHKKYPHLKLDDSKKLKAKDREDTAKYLRKYTYVIKSKSAKEIDRIGISKCIKDIIKNLLTTFIKKTKAKDITILLDGSLKAPDIYKKQSTHTKGDSKYAVISAASIIAKVHRDKYMIKLSKKYEKYGFDIHKGYGTRKHVDNIKKWGLTGEHRKTFML